MLLVQVQGKGVQVTVITSKIDTYIPIHMNDRLAIGHIIPVVYYSSDIIYQEVYQKLRTETHLFEKVCVSWKRPGGSLHLHFHKKASDDQLVITLSSFFLHQRG